MKTLSRDPSAADTGGGPVGSPSGRSARRRRLLWVAAAVALVVGLLLVSTYHPTPVTRVVSTPVRRGALDAVVTATGTVNPQDTISVGTQASGTIETIVADYNDRVHAGDVLARLDPTLFQAALDQARATLQQAQAQWAAAEANARSSVATEAAANANADTTVDDVRLAEEALASADAGVEKARSALLLAQQTVQRDRALLGAGYVPQSQFDSDNDNRVAADAALRTAVAAAAQARTQVKAAQSQARAGHAQGTAAGAQALAAAQTEAAQLALISADQAAVQQALVNLNHTVIISPVDGTVIARNVSVGQTVAASFQTPTLYTIAKDLTKMEIDLAVGEPDVGAVRPGQRAHFTVLAYPNAVFGGTVAQVRENPTTVQNVVTYDTVVYENNRDGRLRPGMTANASIETAHVDDALIVPLAALTFRGAASPRATKSSTPSVWGDTGGLAGTTITAGTTAGVTVLGPRNTSREVAVRVRLTNGADAAIELLAGTLPVGAPIAIGTAP